MNQTSDQSQKKTRITFEIEEQLRDEFKRRLVGTNLSMTDVLVQSIEKWLKDNQ